MTIDDQSPGTLDPDADPSGRAIGLFMLGAAAITVVSLLAAAVGGGPYLGASDFNGWIVVFAAGLLATLISFPFALQHRLRRRFPDRDRRWEVALVAWGVVALAIFGLAIAVGSAAGFETATLGGAVGVIAGLESAIVVAVIVVWVVSA